MRIKALRILLFMIYYLHCSIRTKNMFLQIQTSFTLNEFSLTENCKSFKYTHTYTVLHYYFKIFTFVQTDFFRFNYICYMYISLRV